MQNTAIFYDIENLIYGYKQAEIMASNVSLKEILEKIKSSNLINGIGVQRAYANWSDSRLNVMAKEISELGIEPIQIFGLSRNQKKNAADIQLAVDAIDLAYVRPWLDLFVIVSGDGGFSALGKKLHECGKKVIGCAYKSSTNQIFESVCDLFIPLEEPVNDTIFASKLNKKNGGNNSIAIKASRFIPFLSSKDKSEIIQHSTKIIEWLIHDPEYMKHLNNQGINLSIIREVLKCRIENFNPSSIGILKFIDFFKIITEDLPVVARLMPNNEVKVFFRDNDKHNLQNLDGNEDLLLNLKITNQTVKRMTNDLDRLSTEDVNEIIEQSKRIIDWLTNDNESIKNLGKKGISLSVVKEAFKFGIENFDPRLAGFGKFVEFLQYITVDTQLGVSRSTNNTTSITYRSLSLNELERLPDLDETYIHSPDNYSAILATGKPKFRMLNQHEQYKIISIIFELEEPFINRDFLCNYLDQENIEYELKSVNSCITNLVGANILKDQENINHLPEINLTISPDFCDIDSIVEKILNSMRQKLLDFFDDEFQKDIFEKLINS
ncbi:NYN domain-containing protein [Crocosphaera sp.]|uniref:NYN domain-containing protein n=1 Tax=Crocosphaera sp. TaxID=2729996 RepID=UPI002611A38A|nr:NYN domain-containing protein [Crocosphaera sp.]MDJ0580641.1 NYN domain-containing protein [Crocosphaera sp.]